jgi:hypothetical protein
MNSDTKVMKKSDRAPWRCRKVCARRRKEGKSGLWQVEGAGSGDKWLPPDTFGLAASAQLKAGLAPRLFREARKSGGEQKIERWMSIYKAELIRPAAYTNAYLRHAIYLPICYPRRDSPLARSTGLPTGQPLSGLHYRQYGRLQRIA